jgi:hypothetical protein
VTKKKKKKLTTTVTAIGPPFLHSGGIARQLSLEHILDSTTLLDPNPSQTHRISLSFALADLAAEIIVPLPTIILEFPTIKGNLKEHSVSKPCFRLNLSFLKLNIQFTTYELSPRNRPNPT